MSIILQKPLEVVVYDLPMEHNAIGIDIFRIVGDNQFVVKPVKLEWAEIVNFGVRRDEPSLTLEKNIARLLMKELARQFDRRGGIDMPNTATRAQLEATERHLADMRRITFRQLGIKEKP